MPEHPKPPPEVLDDFEALRRWESEVLLPFRRRLEANQAKRAHNDQRKGLDRQHRHEQRGAREASLADQLADQLARPVSERGLELIDDEQLAEWASDGRLDADP